MPKVMPDSMKKKRHVKCVDRFVNQTQKVVRVRYLCGCDPYAGMSENNKANRDALREVNPVQSLGHQQKHTSYGPRPTLTWTSTLPLRSSRFLHGHGNALFTSLRNARTATRTGGVVARLCQGNGPRQCQYRGDHQIPYFFNPCCSCPFAGLFSILARLGLFAKGSKAHQAVSCRFIQIVEVGLEQRHPSWAERTVGHVQV